jgi:hypothetical protein
MPSFLPMKMQPIFVLPFVLGPRVAGVGQNGFEELKRHYFPALKIDWLNRSHAYILQAFKMRKVALPEGHEKPDSPYAPMLSARDSSSS